MGSLLFGKLARPTSNRTKPCRKTSNRQRSDTAEEIRSLLHACLAAIDLSASTWPVIQTWDTRFRSQFSIGARHQWTAGRGLCVRA